MPRIQSLVPDFGRDAEDRIPKGFHPKTEQIQPMGRMERQTSDRKQRGAFCTPRPVVEFIVRETLATLAAAGDSGGRAPWKILEPSCGDGRFLVEACRQLSVAADGSRRQVLANLYGLDVDPVCVEQTRAALAEAAPNAEASRLAYTIRCGNALIGPDFPSDAVAEPIRPFDWRREFAEIFAGDRPGFDAVIGNPPYLNTRVLSQIYGAAVKRYLAERYAVARRGFDLYLLFLEKAVELLRPGGVCGMIVPNKLAAMDYAAACRQMLLEQTTLVSLSDLSHLHVFAGANVYPWVIVFRKQPAAAEHRIAIFRPATIADLESNASRASVQQRDLTADGGLLLDAPIEAESRVPTLPLGQVAKLHSGATGFVASRLAECLRESDAAGGQEKLAGWPFIVSGNIDRYAIRAEGVRFMNRRFQRPLLPSDATPLSAGKRRLYSQEKIVIAGMTRRLEAALDDRGRALGVQVFAAVEPAVDCRYLLGLLNSKLLSALFRQRFPAKRLGGGYLAINKGQLAKLPIRVVTSDSPPADQREQARLIRLVERRLRFSDGDALRNRRIETIDATIDHCVARLYRLTTAEIELVESSPCGG